MISLHRICKVDDKPGMSTMCRFRVQFLLLIEDSLNYRTVFEIKNELRTTAKQIEKVRIHTDRNRPQITYNVKKCVLG